MHGYLLAAALAVNGLTFAAFGIDKALASAGRRRIAEARLLLLALIGGSPAAWAGRHLFRHKTRKQPFGLQLHGIVAAQVAIALWVGAPWLR